MELYRGQLKEYQFDIEKHRKHHKQKDGKSATSYYNNSIMTFDIEVSSAWLEDGKVISYRKGEDSEYWNNLTPLAICYIWQFSCDGRVYYGRELEDFLKLLDDIPSYAKSYIWVHNLSYEFAFLLNIMSFDSIFARTAHKPMYAIPEKYPNIEFRCSYMLTRLSLETWGNQLGVYKAVGNLDYDIMRTPLTPLTKDELFYCEQDCLVVEAGIKDYVRKYGKQRNIPLTQTGTVRREVKERLFKDSKYVFKIKKLVPRSPEEYKLLQSIFAGGYTHANRKWAGILVEGLIEHYDFASSYPCVMLAEKYPSTPWARLVTKRIPSEDTFEYKAYLMCLTFKNLKCKSHNTYIQASKSLGENIKKDNGRVLSADELTMWMTEQDWLTIKNNYKWEGEVIVNDVYTAYKDYLPRPLLEFMLELYANKTELKDVPGMEDLYMQSKQYINGLFGMSVTAVIQAAVREENGEWITTQLTRAQVDEKLAKLRRPLAGDKKYFMSYSWGIYVTAYARRNLWKCIEHCDKDVLYCDTDSIFVVGKHDFSWYNEEITAKIKKACDTLGLDFAKTHPKTPKGEEKPLGIFAKEDNVTQFKTLGAKRYIERRKKDGKLHLTISGINKGAVELLGDDMNNFKDGFNFDKDAPCVKKKLCTYLTKMPPVVYPDGYVSHYRYGINLRNTGYLLSMTDEYKELIDYDDDEIIVISERMQNIVNAHYSV